VAKRDNKVLAVIPARGGSKRILRKNTRKLGQLPLIAHAIEAAKNARLIDHLIISTDDDEIKRIGIAWHVSVPYKRPSQLSTENAKLISVIKHAFNYYKERNIFYDAVLSIQPTCPFVTPQVIDQVIQLWMETKCDSVSTVTEITHGHPYIAKRVLKDNQIEDYCEVPPSASRDPRQRESAYYLSGSLYLRSKSLLESDDSTPHCLGRDARGVIVDGITSFDIDVELDFNFAEYLIASKVIQGKGNISSYET